MKKVAVLFLVVSVLSCRTPGTPTVDVPAASDGGAVAKPVNCAAQLLQTAIAAATARANDFFAEGLSKVVLFKDLAGLAVDVGPPALACALQYLTGKFASDALNANTPQASAEYQKRRDLAAEFIAQQGYTFAAP